MNSLNLMSAFLLFTLWMVPKPVDVIPAEQFIRLQNYPTITMKAGSSQTAIASFKIGDGYHIMADRGEDSSLLFTQLEISGTDQIQLGDPQFPEPKEYDLLGEEYRMMVFDELMSVQIPVVVSQDTPEGSYTLQGKLFYQACSQAKCYFRKELTFQLTVTVVTG
ncbi:MAG: hypothetical protein DHS20C18_28410 [Saprospiraceae bacterium]|nr:MAG: hypothetical protein DHS20C18_28410 [Saprospiraceae bacterium]